MIPRIPRRNLSTWVLTSLEAHCSSPVPKPGLCFSFIFQISSKDWKFTEAKLETWSEGVWEQAFRPCNTRKDRGRKKDGAEVTVYLQKRKRKKKKQPPNPHKIMPFRGE